MQVELLLAPHNDDETLFAAYVLMRYKPFVVFCLKSFVQEKVWDPPGATWQVREEETDEAMDILNCTWMQLSIPDDEPDWDELRESLTTMADTEMPNYVWAPLPEEGGHAHHNAVGEIAAEIFDDHVIYYSTYTYDRGRTTTGIKVSGELDDEQLKRHAMSSYKSQATDPRTAVHFTRPLDEYYVFP